MKNARTVIRFLLAIALAVFGADKFLHFMPRPDAPPEGGAFLEHPQPPPLGSEARLTLELLEGPEILRIHARVVRRELGVRQGFAVEFDAARLPPEARGRLRAFVSLENPSIQ